MRENAHPTPSLPPQLRRQWRRFADLSPAELYAALAARQAVFVIEQACAYLDADGLDPVARHLLVWDDGKPEPVLAAYLRLLPPGCRFVEPALGRVITTAGYRGRGLGRLVMVDGLAHAAECFPGQPVRIAAQLRLERFYASLGFRVASAPFDEDGIPHVEMLHPGLPGAAFAAESPGAAPQR